MAYLNGAVDQRPSAPSWTSPPSTAMRRRGVLVGIGGRPILAATVISLASLEKQFRRALHPGAPCGAGYSSPFWNGPAMGFLDMLDGPDRALHSAGHATSAMLRRRSCLPSPAPRPALSSLDDPRPDSSSSACFATRVRAFFLVGAVPLRSCLLRGVDGGRRPGRGADGTGLFRASAIRPRSSWRWCWWCRRG